MEHIIQRTNERPPFCAPTLGQGPFRCRTLLLPEKSSLRLTLSDAGHLEAAVFKPVLILQRGQLSAAAPITRLVYNPSLELIPKFRQWVEGSLMTLAQFELDDDRVNGNLLKGHAFQKYETFMGLRLNQVQEIFLPIKKLERHFINPKSDPYYQEIIGQLEKAVRALNSPHPDSKRFGEMALQKGRQAVKVLFPQDQLMNLLVTHLELGLERAWNQESQRQHRHQQPYG